MKLKTFFLLMAGIGTIVPWIFFATFISTNGLDVPGFVMAVFADGASGGFTADVLISILVFWVWSYFDATKHQIRNWWLVIPAGFVVGLSLAMPLYLYFRTAADGPGNHRSSH